MRLIDADALKERAIRVSTVKEHWYMKAVGTHEINKAPTIDAVEVVRCKDCKSGKVHYIEDDYGSSSEVFCILIASYMRIDDFCSYGERKDNDR